MSRSSADQAGGDADAEAVVRRPLPQGTGQPPDTTPPRRVTLLVNPRAGRGRAGRVVGPISDLFRAKGLDHEIVAGADAHQARDRAADAVAGGADALVAVGGDGVVNIAAQVATAAGVSLGIIPSGTGNDAARALGIPLDPLRAANVVIGGERRRIDVGRVLAAPGDAGEAVPPVRSTGAKRGGGLTPGGAPSREGQVFLCVLSSGFDSRVNERADRIAWPRGQALYRAAMLAELRVLRPAPFLITLDGVPAEVPALLVAVGNGPSYGGGMRVCPAADMSDGLLDITIVTALARRQFLRLFPTVYRGRHVRSPAVRTARARTVALAAPGMTAYADGERVGPLPVTVTCVPAALTVLVPRSSFRS